MKPKTRLKWKRRAHAESSDIYLDHDAFLRIDEHQLYQLSIELSLVGPNRVSVARFVYLNEDEVPFFRDIKTHRGTIADFVREFRGLEWNLLAELHAYLDRAARKVNDLMHERETARP